MDLEKFWADKNINKQEQIALGEALGKTLGSLLLMRFDDTFWLRYFAAAAMQGDMAMPSQRTFKEHEEYAESYVKIAQSLLAEIKRVEAEEKKCDHDWEVYEGHKHCVICGLTRTV